MSDVYFNILRKSNNFGNKIPSGRQLPRTPPLVDVKRQLDFSIDDSNTCDELQQNTEVHTWRDFALFVYQTGYIFRMISSKCVVLTNRQEAEIKNTKTGHLISTLMMRQNQVHYLLVLYDGAAFRLLAVK